MDGGCDYVSSLPLTFLCRQAALTYYCSYFRSDLRRRAGELASIPKQAAERALFAEPITFRFNREGDYVMVMAHSDQGSALSLQSLLDRFLRRRWRTSVFSKASSCKTAF